MDYKKLLEKYMASVVDIEGTDFLNSVYLEPDFLRMLK